MLGSNPQCPVDAPSCHAGEVSESGGYHDACGSESASDAPQNASKPATHYVRTAGQHLSKDLTELVSRHAKTLGVPTRNYARMLVEAGIGFGWESPMTLDELKRQDHLQRLKNALLECNRIRDQLCAVAAHQVLSECMTSVAEELVKHPDPSFREDLLLRCGARMQQFVHEEDGTMGALVLGATSVGKSLGCALLAVKLAKQATLETIEHAIDLGLGSRCWIARDGGVRFRDAMRVARARQRHPLGEGEAPEVEEALKACLTILDDMGWEPAWASETLIEVIGYRSNHGLPTIVTSGLTYEQFRLRYGDAVIRRIVQTAGKSRPVIQVTR